MTLFSFNKAIQSEYDKELNYRDNEILKLKRELLAKTETIEMLRKTNTDLIADLKTARNKMFVLSEK